MWFMTVAAAAKVAEGVMSVTRCLLCGLVGTGMSISCSSAVVRRPVAMQGAVRRSMFRNSCEGPTTIGAWVHGTRTLFPFSC